MRDLFGGAAELGRRPDGYVRFVMAAPDNSEGTRTRDAWPILVVLLVALGGVLVVALHDPDTQGDAGSEIVAVAGDEQITRADVQHWTKALAESSGAKGKALEREALRFLVRAAWVEQQAKLDGIEADTATIAARLDEIRSEFKTTDEWVQFLSTNGLTLDDVIRRLRVARLEELLLSDAQPSEPTEREIAEYYDEHRLSLATPEQRTVELVLAADETDGRAALRALQSGEPIASVAKRLSVDAGSRKTGGVVRGVTHNAARDEQLDAALFDAKQGELVGPIKTDDGYVVLRVRSITPPRDRSLVEAQDDIRRLLQQERDAQATEAFAERFEARWRARTNCRTTLRIAQCANGPEPKD